MEHLIIGIAGHPGSGKDEIANYLSGKGFKSIAGGDILRRIMAEHGIPADRTHVRQFVSQLRRERGNAFLVEEMAKDIQGDTAIAGFRNSAEVAFMRHKFPGQFKLLTVEASLDTRYARVIKRGRDGDNVSLERFRFEENAERSENSGSHEMDKLFGMADATVENDGSLGDLHSKIDGIIKTWTTSR